MELPLLCHVHKCALHFQFKNALIVCAAVWWCRYLLKPKECDARPAVGSKMDISKMFLQNPELLLVTLERHYCMNQALTRFTSACFTVNGCILTDISIYYVTDARERSQRRKMSSTKVDYLRAVRAPLLTKDTWTEAFVLSAIFSLDQAPYRNAKKSLKHWKPRRSLYKKAALLPIIAAWPVCVL